MLQLHQHCLCACFSHYDKLPKKGFGLVTMLPFVPTAPGTFSHICCVTTSDRKSRIQSVAVNWPRHTAAAVLTLPDGGGGNGVKAERRSGGTVTFPLSAHRVAEKAMQTQPRPRFQRWGRRRHGCGSPRCALPLVPCRGPGWSRSHGVCKRLPSCRRSPTTRRKLALPLQAAPRVH